MHIIIGGAYQGKTRYAIECLKERLGQEPTPDEIEKNIELNLHLTIKDAIDSGFTIKTLENLVYETTKRNELNDELIITCDEVGLGIIPLDIKERQYRESVGKVLQELVKHAKQVDRVVAGIPIRIK